jgi:flavin reductase (DIM6/NTAB) family NADH-FMN oxidoreductase RutF
MKKKLGPHPYLYPLPTVIVGATVNKKPNFTTISYVGILQHKPPIISISLSKTHYSNEGIKENKSFSVNIPNTKMMRLTDFLGIYSGRKLDKAKLFNVFYGDLLTAPMIERAPVNLECKLVDVLDYNGTSEVFIGEIVQTYSEDKYMKNGLLNMKRIDPFVFSIHTNYFWNIGKKIGQGWLSGLKYKSKVKIEKE